MRKLLFTMVLVLMVFSTYGQGDKFTFSDEQPELIGQYVVVEADSASIEQMYNRTIEWINITYKNPEKVILSKVEDKYIRIEGFGTVGSTSTLGMTIPIDAFYGITFEFKENKAKFELTSLRSAPSAQLPSINMTPNKDDIYKKNGKIRGNIAGYYRDMLNYFNGLATDYESYINEPLTSESDW